MAFNQLYYTSCEHGLSGYAGFQFNAVSDGVDPDTMQRVERLTTYEPPPSMSYQPDDKEIAAAPVALRYDAGGVPVLANVVYVGADYSMRYGNYFAHALVPVGTERIDNPLPIELWRSPQWSTQPVAASTSLARMRGLTAGPIDPEYVTRFLAARSTAGLGALLTAAHDAAVGGRPLMIVDADTDVVAAWVAVASYLLPGAVVSGMSFTTYHHRPTQSPAHIVGVPPDVHDRLAGPELSGFAVFIPAQDQWPDVEEHPLARVLAAMTPTEALQQWRRAEELASYGARSLDDWHPVVLAVVATEGADLDVADCGRLASWMSDAGGHLDVQTFDRVASGLLAQAALRSEHIDVLADAARRVGATDLVQDLEARIVDRWIEGGAPTTDRPSASSEPVRRYAAERISQLLAEADHALGARLVAAGNALRLSLDDAAVSRWAADVLGPAVLGGEALDDGLRPALMDDDALRSGLAERLAAADPDRALAVLESGVGDVFAAAAPDPAVALLLRVAHARTSPDDLVDDLLAIADLRTRGDDPATVSDGWIVDRVGPDGDPVPAVTELLRRLPSSHGRSPVIDEWLSRAMVSPADLDDEAAVTTYVRLCRRVDSEQQIVLTSEADRCVAFVVWLDRTVRPGGRDDARRAASAIADALDRYDDAPLPAQQLMRAWLPARLMALDANTLGDRLSACPETVFERFIDEAAAAIEAERGHPRAAATQWCTMRDLQRAAHPYGGAMEDRIAIPIIARWRRRRVDSLRDELARIDGRLVDDFDQWYVAKQPTWRRVLGRGGAKGDPREGRPARRPSRK